jgi:dihydroorotate dehydrogenase
VKLSPDLEALETAIAVVRAERADGLIVGNTTLQRPGLDDAPPGGLSGAPLGAIAVDRLRRAVSGGLPVIASGGAMTPADIVARLEAGATLVQLYTGLVYEGPKLLRQTLKALKE